jgi:hypothetical protein
MASLMYAKESIIVSTLKDIEEDHRRTQDVNLAGSNVWRSKSVQMTNNLADALLTNTKLTALNMSNCMLNDACVTKLSEVLAHNSSLFHLNLADNKLGRPGLIALGKALGTNTGLISLDLNGHRINSEVCSAFLTMYDTNVTLCKLIWKTDVSGYNLRFTELANRNTEIDRCAWHGRGAAHGAAEGPLPAPNARARPASSSSPPRPPPRPPVGRSATANLSSSCFPRGWSRRRWWRAWCPTRTTTSTGSRWARRGTWSGARSRGGGSWARSRASAGRGSGASWS